MGFADEIGAFVTKTTTKIEDTTREAEIAMATDVVMGTPVVEDTSLPGAGRARGGWDAAGGSGSPDPVGGATIARLTAQIENAQVPGPPIELTNSVDYIAALEFGSSRQAPRGFVRTAAMRFTDHVEAAAKRRADD